MKIIALDPAARCGWAVGNAGSFPQIGVWQLRRKHQTSEDAARNLACYLRDLITIETPGLIAVEDFLNPEAQPSADSAIMSLRLHGAIDAIAGAYGIAVRRTAAAQVRKHFCGQATAVPARKRGQAALSAKQKAENRLKTKQMVFYRAMTLGYFERGAPFDADKGDVAAVFDHAAATFARAPPPRLVMFGEGVQQ